jgi:tRNA threonylcarbamoyladenosine biosynthesis protein TsaE
LVEPYKDSRISVYHFDFYRFTHAEEFLEAGLDEYFEGDGVRLVEWPDRAHPTSPQQISKSCCMSPHPAGASFHCVR